MEGITLREETDHIDAIGVIGSDNRLVRCKISWETPTIRFILSDPADELVYNCVESPITGLEFGPNNRVLCNLSLGIVRKGDIGGTTSVKLYLDKSSYRTLQNLDIPYETEVSYEPVSPTTETEEFSGDGSTEDQSVESKDSTKPKKGWFSWLW